MDPCNNFSYPIALASIRLNYSKDPFDFTIIRKSTNATLFSTLSGELIFSDYYLQITTQTDTTYNYGLGERFNPGFRLRDGQWTIFTRDRGQVIDKGEGKQTYGYYPFYLQIERADKYHINYFRSSSAMDLLKSTKDSNSYFTYKVIGGIFDFRFMLGEILM